MPRRLRPASLVGAAAGMTTGALRAAANATAAVGTAAVRVEHVAAGALPGHGPGWRAGSRVHVPLRSSTPGRRRDRLGAAARRAAGRIARHPAIRQVHWDEGLERVVLSLASGADTESVLEEVFQLLAEHGLELTEDVLDEELTHPGDVREVRTAAAALALDAAGVAGAVAGLALRLPASSRLVTAGVTLLRESPRARAALRGRFGRTGRDLVLAAANAAAHGAGQSPVALVLDAALRTGQLAEATARAALFETAHDEVCAPGRRSVGEPGAARPALRVTPAQEYAAAAGAGSGAGAAAALLVKHDLREAAEAVLAGSPKAARYGPAAFGSVLGLGLARDGVLVRDARRLRRLELVDTLVLEAGALRGRDATRTGADAGAGLDPGAGLDAGAGAGVDAGACIGAGARIGTAAETAPVREEPEADPLTEAVLDAARRAGLHVVLTSDPALSEFTSVADEVAPRGRPLERIVSGLHDEGRTVMTVARVPASGDEEVLRGLLAGDIAVAVTDADSAVAWGADVLARGGLTDVWRLVAAIPAARSVGSRSLMLARAGAALSGLMVAAGTRPRSWPALPGTRHAPVNSAASLALFGGLRSAAEVARARPPKPRARVPWHELTVDEAEARLARAAAEPSAVERWRAAAGRRTRATLGSPLLAPARWTLQLTGAVRKELDDPLTPVLATGAAASALLGSVVDALLVVGAMDLNALAGGIQRLRAEQALAGLAAEQKPKARKVAAGTGANGAGAAGPGANGALTTDAARLAPGDRIVLVAGDVVPADARIVEQEGLEVDESSLTGESLPVGKGTGPTPDAPVAERHCMVFEGTTVVAGEATAVVVGTGERTEAGRAATLAARTPPAAGVQARLQELTRKALPLTLFGGAAVSGLAVLRGTGLRRAVSSGVAVAVAAVPEGLPLVATVAQMAAARRLSRRGVLVRTPRTLEALGRVDTVCFDKTGTLTENRLHLVRVATADGTLYGAEDEHTVEVRTLAARACPQPDQGDGRRPRHATDEAVLAAAPGDDVWEAREELPFEASRGYAAATGRNGADDVLVVKGAPEVVLRACRDLPAHASEAAQRLAGEGLRVLAVATARGRGLEDPLQDLEFKGLLALADVPRPTSAALLSRLRDAGVLPVMLTGDHPRTAHAVAVQLGWSEDTEVITGDELLAMDRGDRAAALHRAEVVARVAPEQKLHVVEALREAGRVVAMTGDGANDAAAIRAADVGVALMTRGSAAARGAADIVLTDGDLSVLADAVDEARALWRSVADAISILIGGNAGEVGFSVLGTLVSGASPLSTRQLLLVNLLTDMFPALAVAVTPSDDESSARQAARPMGTHLLGEPLLRQIRRRGVTTCLGAVTAYLIGRFTPGTVRRSSTMALCGVVGAQLVQTLAGRRHSPLVWVTALGSAAVLAALVQTPGVSHFFGCTPLGPVAWTGVIAAIALAALSPRLEQLPLVRGAFEAGTRAAIRPGELGRTVRDASVHGFEAPAA
ncbi:cation-translocating P-type ATPase [Streptomyces sp. TRM66268-LWL]|uniref:Cation-translocating P-type ATPase n=2 Tax=Streptomyces polyasparticus TaxID=2767826 RepID=A0ABR7SBH2_9ACTN|nr:cation-translocating P-type ATPase [Streptomyces polyasparticus]